MASLITSNSACVTSLSSKMKYIFTLGDGTRLALVETPSGTPIYYTSADQGVTWSASTVLPSASFLPHTGFYSDVIQNSSSQTVLRIWYISSTGVNLYMTTWNGTMMAFPTNTTVLSGTVTHADAVWTGTLWHLAVIQSSNVSVLAYDGSTILNKTPTLFSGTTFSGLSISYSTSFVYVSAASDIAGKTFLLPIVYTSGQYNYNLGGIETAILHSVPHLLVTDPQGNIELLYSYFNTLYYRQRLGLMSYNGEIYLGSQNPNNLLFSAAYNQTSGDLNVFYSTAANYATGELYAVSRTAGTWKPVYRIAGDDASGYGFPSAYESTTVTDLSYMVGTGTGNCSIWYSGFSAASIPSAPINLNPTGTVALGTIPFYWTYVNVSANNLQKYYQVQIYDSNNNLVWDSGQVESSSATATPPPISLGTYTWRVRTWDSITNGGAGTASAWSTTATFTVIQTGNLTISSIISAGSTSIATPASVGSSILTGISMTWYSGNGYSIDSLRSTIYDSGNNVINDTGFNAISPAINPGGIATSTGSQTLVVRPGTVSTVGDGWLLETTQQIQITNGTNTEILTIQTVPYSVVSAQPTSTSVTIPILDLANFAAGDTVTIGPAALQGQRGITFPAQIECLTIQSVASTSLIFTTAMSLSHVGHAIKSDKITTSLMAHTYSSAAYIGFHSIPTWNTNMQNNTQYRLAIQGVDTNGIVTTSPSWTLATYWTPSTAVSSVAWSTDPSTGSITLTWVNPTGAISNTIQRSPAGMNAWTVIDSGTLRSFIIDHPPLNTTFDYQIIVYS